MVTTENNVIYRLVKTTAIQDKIAKCGILCSSCPLSGRCVSPLGEWSVIAVRASSAQGAARKKHPEYFFDDPESAVEVMRRENLASASEG